MCGRARRVVLAGLAFSILAAPLGAQVETVVHGRVEDAVSRQPIADARVFSIDSSSVVHTDSSGAFAIAVADDDSVAILAEQYGYLTQRFDLDDGAESRISVLLLEPAPIELEGVEVVEEGAVTTLLRALNRRRNFYEGSLAVFDRARLERFAPVGSVWDFVRSRLPHLFECNEGVGGLCARGRAPTPENPDPRTPVLVCVDGWRSLGAVGELQTLPIESVALIEFYGRGRGGIRVYTAGYLASSARTGRYIAPPLWLGC